MKRKKLIIGLFGFGCVGKGLYDVLHQTKTINASIKKICVRNRDKQRAVAADHFTFDRYELLNDPEINVIVELIDDADAAFAIVSEALKRGKAVVSANKKMIAEHFEELLELQQDYDSPLLYEAACCASIPVIRNLEEYYDNDLLQSFEGIVNGSTNYILTRIFDDALSFTEALRIAQEKGFAESNPALDIEGFDAKNKLVILLAHAFGVIIKPEDIFSLGIQHIGEIEARYAKEKGYRIKLVARAIKQHDRIAAFVMPQFVQQDCKLFEVNDEYNGLLLEGIFSEKQFFYGKGAGAFPTASAVLSDISALSYQYRYEYKKIKQLTTLTLKHDFQVEVFVRFGNENQLEEKDFDSISEKYDSNTGSYLVGKISFLTLMNAAWLNQPGISLLLTEKALIEYPVLKETVLALQLTD